MEWTVVLAGPARKSLKRIPAGDKTRILAALRRWSKTHFKGISASFRAFLASAAAWAIGGSCSKLCSNGGKL